MNRFLILIIGFVIVSMTCNAQQIVVYTNHTSMILNVSEAKKLELLHYGAKLQKPEELLINKKKGVDAYPAFGLYTDYQPAFSMTQSDGNVSALLLFEDYEQQVLNNGTVKTVIRLKDDYYPVIVEMHYLAYPKEDIIEQWVNIINKGKQSIKLHEYASSYLHFKRDNYYLTHFHGSWGNEMNLKEEALDYGMKVIDTKLGVEAGDLHTAAYVLSLDKPASEDDGEVIMGALSWSGNYRLTFDVDDKKHLHIVSGINPYQSTYTLDKGENLITPKMIQTYTTKGKGQASRNMHRWARNYIIPLANQERKTLINSWEAVYFMPNEEKVKEIIDGASELGIEMFVLDDGWFGNEYPRNDAYAGLGDWQVTKEKFPNGLEAVIQHAENKGLLFGIWVEPEAVNPKSKLYEKHPEWVIQQPNRKPVYTRNQLTLDLSNPEVQDFMVETVTGILNKYPQIAYVKWDANSVITNFGSAYLGSERQTQLWVDYVKGLYSVLERIKTEYPNVIFQACGGGGSRADYGMLRYMNEFWTSDDTDAHQRIFIQWGTSHIMPAMCMAAHVSTAPNHQTGRNLPIKFRCDVAMSGRMGMEMQPKWMTDKEKTFASSAIAEYKRIRPIVQFGDLYRLRSPYDGELASLMYVSEDENQAVLFAWSMQKMIGTEYTNVRLNGLQKKQLYKIVEINIAPNEKGESTSEYPYNMKELSGEYLMSVGLNLFNSGRKQSDYQSVVFKLKKVN